MEKYIDKDFDFTLSKEELLKAIRIPDDPMDEDFIEVMAMLKEALGCARPKFAYCISAVEHKGEDYVVVEGRRIDSVLVRKNLEKVHRIIPYVATCGMEAELWSNKYTELLEQFWADEIKKLILYKAYEVMKGTVKERFFPAQDLSHMSPGSLPAWSITGQTALFDLIGNVKEELGVALTDSFLMLPSKSISGFFFSGETHYENCRLCPMPNCPNRRAKYMP